MRKSSLPCCLLLLLTILTAIISAAAAATTTPIFEIDSVTGVLKVQTSADATWKIVCAWSLWTNIAAAAVCNTMPLFQNPLDSAGTTSTTSHANYYAVVSGVDRTTVPSLQCAGANFSRDCTFMTSDYPGAYCSAGRPLALRCGIGSVPVNFSLDATANGNNLLTFSLNSTASPQPQFYSVCSTGMTDKTARALCVHRLGYKPHVAFWTNVEMDENTTALLGNHPIMMTFLDCTGNGVCGYHLFPQKEQQFCPSHQAVAFFCDGIDLVGSLDDRSFRSPSARAVIIRPNVPRFEQYNVYDGAFLEYQSRAAAGNDPGGRVYSISPATQAAMCAELFPLFNCSYMTWKPYNYALAHVFFSNVICNNANAAAATFDEICTFDYGLSETHPALVELGEAAFGFDFTTEHELIVTSPGKEGVASQMCNVYPWMAMMRATKEVVCKAWSAAHGVPYNASRSIISATSASRFAASRGLRTVYVPSPGDNTVTSKQIRGSFDQPVCYSFSGRKDAHFGQCDWSWSVIDPTHRCLTRLRGTCTGQGLRAAIHRLGVDGSAVTRPAVFLMNGNLEKIPVVFPIDRATSVAVCRMSGFSRAHNGTVSVSPATRNNNYWDTTVDHLTCPETAVDVGAECDFALNHSGVEPGTSTFVGIDCGVTRDPYEFQLLPVNISSWRASGSRFLSTGAPLSNASNSNRLNASSGIVAIKVPSTDVYGGLCADQVNLGAMHVICRNLGFVNTSVLWQPASHLPPDFNVAVSSMICPYGSRPSLSESNCTIVDSAACGSNMMVELDCNVTAPQMTLKIEPETEIVVGYRQVVPKSGGGEATTTSSTEKMIFSRLATFGWSTDLNEGFARAVCASVHNRTDEDFLNQSVAWQRGVVPEYSSSSSSNPFIMKQLVCDNGATGLRHCALVAPLSNNPRYTLAVTCGGKLPRGARVARLTRIYSGFPRYSVRLFFPGPLYSTSYDFGTSIDNSALSLLCQLAGYPDAPEQYNIRAYCDSSYGYPLFTIGVWNLSRCPPAGSAAAADAGIASCKHYVATATPGYCITDVNCGAQQAEKQWRIIGAVEIPARRASGETGSTLLMDVLQVKLPGVGQEWGYVTPLNAVALPNIGHAACNQMLGPGAIVAGVWQSSAPDFIYMNNISGTELRCDVGPETTALATITLDSCAANWGPRQNFHSYPAFIIRISCRPATTLAPSTTSTTTATKTAATTTATQRPYTGAPHPTLTTIDPDALTSISTTTTSTTTATTRRPAPTRGYYGTPVQIPRTALTTGAPRTVTPLLPDPDGGSASASSTDSEVFARVGPPLLSVVIALIIVLVVVVVLLRRRKSRSSREEEDNAVQLQAQMLRDATSAGAVAAVAAVAAASQQQTSIMMMMAMQQQQQQQQQPKLGLGDSPSATAASSASHTVFQYDASLLTGADADDGAGGAKRKSRVETKRVEMMSADLDQDHNALALLGAVSAPPAAQARSSRQRSASSSAASRATAAASSSDGTTAASAILAAVARVIQEKAQEEKAREEAEEQTHRVVMPLAALSYSPHAASSTNHSQKPAHVVTPRYGMSLDDL